MRKCSFLLLALFVVLSAGSALAQGGNADPSEIKFAKGRSSAEVAGSLTGDEQAEYTFNARKGQKVTISNANRRLFSITVFNPEIKYNSGDFSEATFSFTAPENCDYLLYIRKTTKTPRTANYALVLAIK